MTHLQTLFEQYLGKDVILYTTDGYSDRMINCGSLPTLFTTVDFGAGKESKAELDGVLSRLCSRRTCKILSAQHMIHVCAKKTWIILFFLIILITTVLSFTNSLSRTSFYFSLKTSFVYSNLFSRFG